jgi:glyoxylase-like metal-dependent hydrolase (beta-lactamase superfamily II)
MKYWVTKGGHRIEQVLWGRSNTFLVSNGMYRLLVDCGRQSAYKRLCEGLGEASPGNRPLAALILTHCHFDHAGNAAAVRERWGAKIVVHRSEADHLVRGENPDFRGTMLINRALTGLLADTLLSRSRYRPAHADILVDDRYDLTNWGFDAYLLHTPGHSPGSISVVVGNEIAIAGDAVYGVLPGSVLPPLAADAKAMVLSWKRLLDTGCALFLAGHGRGRSRDLLRRQYERHRKRFGA